MLLAASVCPYPPLIVPEVSHATPDWLAELRMAVAESVRSLITSGATRVIAIGAGSETLIHDSDAGGSLRQLGPDLAYGGSNQVLPLSLTIAAQLLDHGGWRGPRSYLELAVDMGPIAAAAEGAQLAGTDEPIALLVMGDGSARRTNASPGPFDNRAIRFDGAAFEALGAADHDALLNLDPMLAKELWVAGLPAWQCLAGAARAALDSGATIEATTSYDDAPTGVGYVVVDWRVS